MKEKESERKTKQMENEFAQKSKQIQNDNDQKTIKIRNDFDEKTMTIQKDFEQKFKQTEINFELAKLDHLERIETRKAAAQEKKNQHDYEMEKLSFGGKQLDLIKTAINHSAVKNENIIPGMILHLHNKTYFREFFLCKMV